MIGRVVRHHGLGRVVAPAGAGAGATLRLTDPDCAAARAAVHRRKDERRRLRAA